jgi:glucokinase
MTSSPGIGQQSQAGGYAIGVDVGGSSAKMGIVTDAGEIICRHRVATPLFEQPALVAEEYAKGVRFLLKCCPELASQIVGIGIGMPGHISPDRRAMTFGNVHTLDNFPIADFLSERFQLPVELDNDATLAAVAEYVFGGGGEAGRLLVVTVGTGIGAGLIIDGQPQRPVRGCLGDPGHIIVAPQSSWQCGCGCRGCLETVASSLAIEREATSLASQDPDSQLSAILKNKDMVSTAEVIEAAQQSDALARWVLEQAGRWLGIGLASWCYFFDPDLILIGGGVSAAGELLLSATRRAMAKFGMPVYVSNVRVALAEIGNDAGIIGAAARLLHPL